MAEILSHCWKPGKCKLNGLQRESTRTEPQLSRLCKLEWRKWLLICVLWLVEMLVTASSSMCDTFFPVEAEKKGSGPLTTGVIFSASPLSLMVCSPIFGHLLPKVGIKITLICGILLIGGGIFVMRFLIDVPSGWVFITSAIFMELAEGAGWAMYQTSVFTFLAQVFPNHVATATGCVEVAACLGYALGPPIGGVLYSIGGFTLPFTVVGVIILLLPLPTMVLLRPSSVSPQSLPLKKVLSLLSNLTFVVLLLGNTGALVAVTYYVPTIQPFLLKEFGLSPLQIGLLFLPYVIVDVPLSLAVGWLSDKFGTRSFIVSGFFIGGISLFFVGPASFISKPQLWIVIIAFIIVDIGLISIYVPVYSDLLELALLFHPNEEKTGLISVVSGLIVFSTSLGELVGPIVGGGLVEISDFPTSSVVMGELLLAQGLLLLGVTGLERLFNSIKEKLQSSNHFEVTNSY